MRLLSIGCFSWVLIALIAGLASSQEVPPLISFADPYAPEKLTSGTLNFHGSRTMSQLAAVWVDGFRHVHPEVEAKFDFHGSDSALEKLGSETSSIGLMSRELTAADRDAFAKGHTGLKLIEVDAAFDAIAVVVHPDNPISVLSLAQLKTLFGKSEKSETLQWGQLGLEGDWAKTPVQRFAPDEHSGARGQFYLRVLGADGQPATVTPHAWHSKVVEDVAKHKGAVGFVSYAHSRIKAVRTVSLAAKDGGAAIAISAKSISSNVYPLTRPLSLIVVAGDAGIKDPVVAEFVRYVLSRNGQEDVIKDGFQPLGRGALHEQFDRLGWNKLK